MTNTIASLLLILLSGADAFGAPAPRRFPGRSLRLPAFSTRLPRWNAALVRPVRAGLPIPAAEPGDLRIYDRFSRGAPVTTEGLSAAQREALWSAARSHPVAGLDALAKYDPTGIIGFCFGRSTAVHLFARAMGLGNAGIRKLFVVGDLRSGETPEWRFHVAALVKGEDAKWYAIDPIFPGPMEASEWNAQVREIWDKSEKAQFYLTDADAVIPQLERVPPPEQETGERIIELSFDPSRREGFSRVDGFGERVYVLSGAQERRHFVEAGRFDFRRVAINDAVYDYNGYFADLLQSMLNPQADASTSGPKRRSSGPEGAFDIRRAPLGLRLP